MGPGSEERLSFRLTPLLYSNIAKGVRPEIEITIKARGERILESGSVEMVSSVETRKIVLATDITLSSKIVRSAGNLENSGPIPPKADAPTTYTVVWSINNSFNQVSNVEVRATLPSYVKWTNIKSPASEIFSFNPVSNEVVWSVGFFFFLLILVFLPPPKKYFFFFYFFPKRKKTGKPPGFWGEGKKQFLGKNRSH